MMILVFVMACDPTTICDTVSYPPEIYVGRLDKPAAFGAELDSGADSTLPYTSPREGLIEVTAENVLLTYTDVSGRTWQVSYEIGGQIEP